MLLVLAWSGVGFNLNMVYQPVMGSLLDKRDMNALPVLDQPIETPGLNMRAAQLRGRSVINAAAEHDGFRVEHETFLFLDRAHGVYRYSVKTNREMGGVYGETIAILDADTGALKLLITPDTDSIGNVIHRWIMWLHTANVFGLPMQILICITGLIVATLSITGVVIWMKKRKVLKKIAKNIRSSKKQRLIRVFRNAFLIHNILTTLLEL